MPTQDQEFIQKLRDTFKVEAEEHLQAISATLLELEKPTDGASGRAGIESIYREAHNLKGAARAVDMLDIEAICQAMEGVFSICKREKTTPSSEACDTLHHALDTIRSLLGSLETELEHGNRQKHDELIQRLQRLQNPAPSAISREPAAAEAVRLPSASAEKSTTSDTVRISIAKLDSLLLQAEDLLVVKAMAARHAAELRDLAAMLEQWHKAWAKVSSEARTLRQAFEKEEISQSRGRPNAVSPALAGFLDWNREYFRSLENKLVSLAAQAEQDRHSAAKRVDDLLEDTKKLLMLPFSSLAGIFPKLVRDLCRDQDKQADFAILGAEIEIDKRILEEMKDALIHILRNCVDHGVEKPAERTRLNKPARATIGISVSPVNGNKVEIVISDDGAGVDLARVKESAVCHGILSEADARALHDPEALSLAFHSEVSASPIVTEISGRGLGMAIVRSKAEKLGGKVSIESDRQVGTTVRMLLPLTLATFRGVIVGISDRLFVVPTVNIERVLRVSPRQIQLVGNHQAISLQGRILPLVTLATVLGLPAKQSLAGESAATPAIVLHWAGQRIAFAVDQVLHEEEVLVKPLSKPLVRVRNIAGVTVLGSGKAVPILNVPDLMKSARMPGTASVNAPDAGKAKQMAAKDILVVEDSITSRMLLKGILESAGHKVTTAVDGVNAFTALREKQFDVVVSDVEMPRMNGFDLTARIRADQRLVDLPVVLVTALESRQERERGIDAGANAYIVKSTFDQSNLLEIIRRLA